MTKNKVFSTLLLVVLCAGFAYPVEPAFRSHVELDNENGEDISLFPATVAGRMNRAFYGNYDSAAVYRAIDPDSTPLRLFGQPFSTAMGSNQVGCYDLASGERQWQQFLDTLVLQLIQTDDYAVVLTVTSLYAFDLSSGKPLWQVDTRSGQPSEQISLRRTLRTNSWTNDESAVADLQQSRSRLSLVGYQKAADRFFLSLENGEVITVGRDGTVSAPTGLGTAGDEPVVSGFHPVGEDLFIYRHGRRIDKIDHNTPAEIEVSAHMPEEMIMKSITGYQSDGILISMGSFFWRWDPQTNDVSEFQNDTLVPNKLCHRLKYRTDRGYLSFHEKRGLVLFDDRSLEPHWTYEGEHITTWITVLRFRGPVPIAVIHTDETAETPWLLAFQYNRLVRLELATGRVMEEIAAPVFPQTTKGINWTATGLYGAAVPPYVDQANRRAYFVTSVLTDGLDSDGAPRGVRDAIVEVSW